MSKAASSDRSLSYRPDIDGLRALAVLSVIGFHAGRLLPGGYVGVDVFFIISGFLITSIICRQLAHDTFTFADFYARRCKRIFPSLIVVLAAVWMFGWMVMLPDEYERLGKHIAAGAGFIANFAFWQEAGYFDKAAESKPLLHLWSLGIEEQFYLLWPLLLVWAWKKKWNLLNVIASIISISFVLNVMLVSLWQAEDAFYLPPVRFWELLLGGLLAYVHVFENRQLDRFLERASAHFPVWCPVSVHDIQAAVGLLLFLVSIVILNGQTLFPGWWGVLPASSAFFMISAGPKAWVNRRILASSPLVFVGLISYPLYLWHWPLLSYAHILESGTPSEMIQMGAVSVAFLLAWLTYRIVERPVRVMTNPAALILAPSLMVIGCLGLASFSHWFHIRSEKYGLEKIVEAAGQWDFPGNLKFVHSPVGPYWEQGPTSPEVLFIGDSNMQQYYPRIDKLLTDFPDRARSVVFVTQLSCAPIRLKDFDQPYCVDLLDRAMYAAQHHSIETVVIAASWPRYNAFTQPGKSETAFRALEDAIRDFRRTGRQVYLILPMPNGAEFNPYHLVRRSIRDFGFQVVPRSVDRTKIVEALQPVSSRLVQVANSSGATAIDPVEYLCRDGNCATLTEDGMPMYMDDTHLRASYVRDHVTFLDSIVLDPSK